MYLSCYTTNFERKYTNINTINTYIFGSDGGRVLFFRSLSSERNSYGLSFLSGSISACLCNLYPLLTYLLSNALKAHNEACRSNVKYQRTSGLILLLFLSSCRWDTLLYFEHLFLLLKWKWLLTKVFIIILKKKQLIHSRENCPRQIVCEY